MSLYFSAAVTKSPSSRMSGGEYRRHVAKTLDTTVVFTTMMYWRPDRPRLSAGLLVPAEWERNALAGRFRRRAGPELIEDAAAPLHLPEGSGAGFRTLSAWRHGRSPKNRPTPCLSKLVDSDAMSAATPSTSTARLRWRCLTTSWRALTTASASYSRGHFCACSSNARMATGCLIHAATSSQKGSLSRGATARNASTSEGAISLIMPISAASLVALSSAPQSPCWRPCFRQNSDRRCGRSQPGSVHLHWSQNNIWMPATTQRSLLHRCRWRA